MGVRTHRLRGDAGNGNGQGSGENDSNTVEKNDSTNQVSIDNDENDRGED
ncbi:MAG: hypothetical protein ACRD8W_25155 [Nitrososphaeraceae archaeon]